MGNQLVHVRIAPLSISGKLIDCLGRCYQINLMHNAKHDNRHVVTALSSIRNEAQPYTDCQDPLYAIELLGGCAVYRKPGSSTTL